MQLLTNAKVDKHPPHATQPPPAVNKGTAKHDKVPRTVAGAGVRAGAGVADRPQLPVQRQRGGALSVTSAGGQSSGMDSNEDLMFQDLCRGLGLGADRSGTAKVVRDASKTVNNIHVASCITPHPPLDPRSTPHAAPRPRLSTPPHFTSPRLPDEQVLR